MDVTKIVAEINKKIASLQQARTVLLSLDEDTADSGPRRGRPRGATKAANAVGTRKTARTSKRKRTLSPEGRKAIAEAMKRRWAEHRKDATAATKATAAAKAPAAAKKVTPNKQP